MQSSFPEQEMGNDIDEHESATLASNSEVFDSKYLTSHLVSNPSKEPKA